MTIISEGCRRRQQPALSIAGACSRSETAFLLWSSFAGPPWVPSLGWTPQPCSQPWQRGGQAGPFHRGLWQSSSENRAPGLPWALRRPTVQAADGYLSVTLLLFSSLWLMNWNCSVLGFPWGQTALLKMSIENAVNLSSLKMDRIQKCESSKKRCNCIISVKLPGCISPAQRFQPCFAQESWLWEPLPLKIACAEIPGQWPILGLAEILGSSSAVLWMPQRSRQLTWLVITCPFMSIAHPGVSAQARVFFPLPPAAI